MMLFCVLSALTAVPVSCLGMQGGYTPLRYASSEGHYSCIPIAPYYAHRPVVLPFVALHPCTPLRCTMCILKALLPSRVSLCPCPLPLHPSRLIPPHCICMCYEFSFIIVLWTVGMPPYSVVTILSCQLWRCMVLICVLSALAGVCICFSVSLSLYHVLVCRMGIQRSTWPAKMVTRA